MRKSFSESGYDSRESANEALKALLKDIKEKEKLAPRQSQEKTFDDLFDEYLKLEKARDIEEQTYHSYQAIVDRYLKPRFGERLVSDLTTLETEQFLAEMKISYSGGTVVKIYRQLKNSLKKTKSWKWRSDNPMEDVPAPKRTAKAKKTRKELPIRDGIHAGRTGSILKRLSR